MAMALTGHDTLKRKRCAVCSSHATRINLATDAAPAYYTCDAHAKDTGWCDACTYYAFGDGALANGSYIRRDVRVLRGKMVQTHVQYMQGDYMGEVSQGANGIHPEMKAYAPADARKHLPKCCA